MATSMRFTNTLSFEMKEYYYYYTRRLGMNILQEPGVRIAERKEE